MKPYLSSNEELPQYIRRRSVPDVPEDYTIDHLNDPNLDLKTKMGKPVGSESLRNRKNLSYAPSDTDGDYSDARSMGSRDSSAIEYEEESPYPEVRAAVSNTDDPSMPVNTFRM